MQASALKTEKITAQVLRDSFQSRSGAIRKLTNPGAKAMEVMAAIRDSGACSAARSWGMVINRIAPFTPRGHRPKPSIQIGGTLVLDCMRAFVSLRSGARPGAPCHTLKEPSVCS